MNLLTQIIFLFLIIGFSVGDELGFRQSLSNLEGNKRRSLSSDSTSPDYYAALSKKSDKSITMNTNSVRSTSLLRSSTQLSTLPPFKPIPIEDSSTPLKPIVAVPGYVVGPVDGSSKGIKMVAAPKFSDLSTVPQFHALPASITTKISSGTHMKAPTAFKNSLHQATNNFQTPTILSSNKLTHRTPSYSSSSPQIVNVVQIDRSSSSNSSPIKVLPTAIPVSNAISTEEKKPVMLDSQMMGETIKTLSQASNISEDAIAAAINMRQQQMLQQQTKPKVITTTTTTERVFTTEPVKKYPLSGPSKVMNAPKEYYPVGYDKNFDDNFVSRVELPDTSFYCGEQKHFPGLYADEDLGCMVFHVCAFTDDGLIMKSFLCPESTLFDQSILKCNWWFYVDCKASKKLYDSNIPISKSYQLMKALAFFSTYNKSS